MASTPFSVSQENIIRIAAKLFDRGRRRLALKHFDICRDRDGLDIFQMLIPGALYPCQKIARSPGNRQPACGRCGSGPTLGRLDELKASGRLEALIRSGLRHCE